MFQKERKKPVVSGPVFGVGDFIAQLVFPSGTAKNNYDFARTARAVLQASCIFSFMGNTWYGYLNKRVE